MRALFFTKQSGPSCPSFSILASQLCCEQSLSRILQNGMLEVREAESRILRLSASKPHYPTPVANVGCGENKTEVKPELTCQR